MMEEWGEREFSVPWDGFSRPQSPGVHAPVKDRQCLIRFSVRQPSTSPYILPHFVVLSVRTYPRALFVWLMLCK